MKRKSKIALAENGCDPLSVSLLSSYTSGNGIY